MIREQLLREIDDFLRRHELTDYAFGKRAIKDGHVVRRLREGKDITLKTLESLKKYMRDKDEKVRSVAL